MKVIVTKTAEDLGAKVADICKELISKAIEKNGTCRMVFSTGASQFTSFEALLKEDIDWSSVEMFHLDEYLDLPETHKASFKKYLKERFTDKVKLKNICFVGTLPDSDEEIERLTTEIRKKPIDIGLIGIGENAHIAFNDPPADFNDQSAYKIVELDKSCKSQQVKEGWFDTIDDVPRKAISMTVKQIMDIDNIICPVPNDSKATAIKRTLENDVTNTIPATKLKEHKNVTVVLDENSSKLCSESLLAQYY